MCGCVGVWMVLSVCTAGVVGERNKENKENRFKDFFLIVRDWPEIFNFSI